MKFKIIHHIFLSIHLNIIILHCYTNRISDKNRMRFPLFSKSIISYMKFSNKIFTCYYTLGKMLSFMEVTDYYYMVKTIHLNTF
ncbi:hypothetical protein HMPREF9089_00498 [Eubacterium brachy ATCC 33089]|nr:hypothetical protein HMPREF9089_00498 [Eubacterium brachy ATCC 33089]